MIQISRKDSKEKLKRSEDRIIYIHIQFLFVTNKKGIFISDYFLFKTK